MYTLRLVVFGAVLLAGIDLTLLRAADWTYEERPDAQGGKIYAARAGSSVGFDCGSGIEPSLWVTVNVIGGAQNLAGTEASIGFLLSKKGWLGPLGRSTETELVFGRYDQSSNPVVATARINGPKAIEVARQLSRAEAAQITVEAKTAAFMPTRGERKVALSGADEVIGRVLQSCRMAR